MLPFILILSHYENPTDMRNQIVARLDRANMKKITVNGQLFTWWRVGVHHNDKKRKNQLALQVAGAIFRSGQWTIYWMTASSICAAPAAL